MNMSELQDGSRDGIPGSVSGPSEAAGKSGKSPVLPGRVGDAPVEQPLNPGERTLLDSFEKIIGMELHSFLSVGSALAEIRDKRLYRGSHKTFEEYCRKRWDFTRAHANRLVGATKVMRILAPIGAKIHHESQLRPLVGLADADVVTVWKKAHQLAAGGNVTARNVRRAALELKGSSGLSPKALQTKQPRRKRRNPKPALKLVQKAVHAADG